jgi:hypothetical protein
VLSHPPDLGRFFSIDGNIASKVKGNANDRGYEIRLVYASREKDRVVFRDCAHRPEEAEA